MRKRLLLALLVLVVGYSEGPVRSQTARSIRIGLNQNAPAVNLRAARPFTVQQNSTRTAKFTMVLALDPSVNGSVTKASLQYRTLVELDGGKLIVLPKNEKTRIDAGNSSIEFDSRTYRGI